MYCSKCGQAIGSQTFCPNCGTPTGVPQAAGMPYVTRMPYTGWRVARHLRTLGILWIVFAVYMVLHWMLIMPIIAGILGGHGSWFADSNTIIFPFHFGSGLIHIIAVAVFVRAILSLAVGVALMTRQPWGRIYAIVIAFLTLLKPFTGTILAIYTLWVLLGHNSGVEYDQIVLAGEVGPAYPGVPPVPPVPPAPTPRV